MLRISWQTGLIGIIASAVALLLLTSVAAAPARPFAGQTIPLEPHADHQPAIGLTQVITYNTIITVTSSADPNNFNNEVCYEAQTAGQTVRDECTLRRALIEANATDPAERPVLISFNLPITDTGYVADPGIWKINLRNALPEIGDDSGRITIDGSTQPGGRSTGPNVIIQNRSFVVTGSLPNETDNVIRGLGFQNADIQVNSDNALIEDNWLGLSDDGQSFYLRTTDPRSTGLAAIDINADNAVVRNNITLSGNGIQIQGTGNVVRGNRVGTNADGIVPEIPANRVCRQSSIFDNWIAGGGIEVSGSNNIIGGPTAADRNIIVGTFILGAPTEAGIAFFAGSDNIAQNNLIGRDASGRDVGVCDQGIRADGKNLQLLDNVIVGSRIEAIGVFGSATSAGEITWRGNQIIAPGFKDGVQFGQNIPDAWKLFEPAVITSITGTLVTGTSAPGFDCPNCVIELYLDNNDDTVEALRSLAVVTATADGSWTATLTSTLAANEGIRTSSTSTVFDTIPGYGAGTSTDLSSELYGPAGVITPVPTPPDPPYVPQPPQPRAIFPTLRPVPPLPTPTYASVITVTSTQDNTGQSQTCYTEPNAGNTAVSPCTLRRALTEASALPDAQRPVLIRFDISTSDPGYDATSETWTIRLTNGNLPDIERGNITLDGTTQPGGRTDGPTIVIEGSPLIVARDNPLLGNYIIRGFLLRDASIQIDAADSFIEDNWAGYSLDGQQIFFPGDSPGANNNASIRVGQFSQNVVVRNNRLAGSRSIGIDVEGNDSYVVGNYVGTRVDGTVPPPPNPADPCNPNPLSGNWYGGYGLQISGSRNQITDNVIAGLNAAGVSTPPESLNFSGNEHYIFNNRIGVDANNQPSFSCGTGMLVDGEFTQVLSNTIYGAGGEGAFFISGTGNNTVSLRDTAVISPSRYVGFGINVPVSLRFFNPARITSVSGTTVSGTAGNDSPCPFCTVELFLENDDDVIETLESLAVVTATQDGTWTATLPRPLSANERLRTVTTLNDFDIIPNFEQGTTVPSPSVLYPQVALTDVTLAGATTSEVGVANVYTATISPLEAGRPLSLTLEATDLDVVPVDLLEGNDTVSYTLTWAQPGTKTITVTASNEAGIVSDTLTVVVSELPAAITGVSLDGAASGETGTAYTFTATSTPANATTPITYTWQADEQSEVTGSDGITATQQFTWSTAGTKTITVTADNGLGTATDTFQIAIDATTTPVAPTSVSIAGTANGLPNTAYSFTAQVLPPNTTTPITYTWVVDEQSAVSERLASLTNQQSYTWATTGTRTLSVTADNGVGVVTDTFSINIVDTLPSPTPIASLDLTGPASGFVGASATFTVTASPADATTPITYTWEASEQTPVTVLDNLTNSQSFTWLTDGTKTITVTAENGGTPVVTTFQINQQFQPQVQLTPNEPIVFFPAAGTRIEFPGTAVSATVTVSFTAVSERTPPANVDVFRRLVLFGTGATGVVSTTETSFQVFVVFDPTTLPAGTTANDIRVFVWDGTQWLELTEISRPLLAQGTTQTLSFSTNLLSEFLITVPQSSNRVYLPLIVRALQ